MDREFQASLDKLMSQPYQVAPDGQRAKRYTEALQDRPQQPIEWLFVEFATEIDGATGIILCNERTSK